MTGQQTGKRDFRHPFRQRHNRRNGHSRRSAKENVNPQQVAPGNRFSMVSADAAMNLIMKTGLLVLLIAVAGDLNPVHTKVGLGKTGGCRAFTVHLRQSQKGAAIPRPGYELRQSAEGR